MGLLLFVQSWAVAGLERIRREQSGQGAVEYVGIVIVVVAIIAAIAVLAPEIGQAIGEGLRSIVNNFVGGGG